MENIKKQIETIGKATSSDELNASYNQLMLAISQYDFSGITSRSEMERTLNHITNYNLVRIANEASEAYEASGRTDKSLLIEIGRCRDSIKEHDDNKDEIDLLDSLCDQFQIR